MRVLVSGSTGLIGGALVERLRAGGHTVHPLVRRPPHPGEAAIDLSAGTLDTSQLPGGSLEGLDAVVNLAGEPLAPTRLSDPPRWSRTKKQRILSSRVVTTRVLSQALAALTSPPAVLVSASAIGYYGDRGDELLVEGARPGRGFLAEVCVGWEQATAAAEEAGIRVVHLRSGLVLGDGGVLKLLVPFFRAGLGARIGSGEQWWSWISLADEVGVILHAIADTELSGPVNSVSPQPVHSRELTSGIAAVVSRPVLLSLPAGPLRLAFGPDASANLLDSQRAVPRRLERSVRIIPGRGDAMIRAA